MQGGGPAVVPGQAIPASYSENNPALVEQGLDNLMAHLDIVQASGVTPVVCLNHFVSDHEDEVSVVKKAMQAKGVRVAVSKHWEHGGKGALELAQIVLEACEEASDFKFLYPDDLPLTEKIECIATQVYGARSVIYQPQALAQLKVIEADPTLALLACCMAKTHLSLSDDPTRKGRPTDWDLTIRELRVYQGAGLIVPVAGDIKLMPGTASDPAYRRIDVDLESGRVTGLF